MDPTTTLSIWSDYFCLKRNKLKWSSTLADLKAFLHDEIDEQAAANSSQRSPSGGTWVFEIDQLKITWHSKSENISFEGASGKDLAERITSLLTRADNERAKANPVEAEPVKSIEIKEGEPVKSIQINEGCETEHSEVIDVNESRESNGANN
jgi:hypothetical protein